MKVTTIEENLQELIATLTECAAAIDAYGCLPVGVSTPAADDAMFRASKHARAILAKVN